MSVVKRAITVDFSTEQMYQLVNAVQDYPMFLPWCQRVEVHTASDEVIQATVYMSKGPLRHKFTTKNVLQKDHSITMHYVDGPFKQLEGQWLFEAITPSKCHVSLHLEYAFINKWLSLAIEPIFYPICHSLIEAFKQRAEALYGVSTTER